MISVQEAQLSAQRIAENEYRRALSALQEGRVSEAVEHLQQGLLEYPRHGASRETLIRLLLENKRQDEAVVQLRLSLGIDPKQPQMAMMLARLQVEKGGPAINTLMRTLPYASGNGEYLAFLAAVLQRGEHHREAAERYQQALLVSPKNALWWMGLGISLQADKRATEAADAYTRALAQSSLSPDLQAFVERKLQQVKR